MILINLLPHREEKRRRRKVAFFAGLGVAAGVGLGIVGLWFLVVQQMTAAQQERNEFLTAEIKKLEVQIKDIATLKAEIEALKARQKAVEDLQIDRNVPVHILNELVKQTPEGIYFKTIKQDGQTLSVSGIAQTQERISELLRNTAYSSEWLVRPELIESKATNASSGPNAPKDGGRQLFEFGMRLAVKRPQEAASAPAGAASGAAPVTPAAAAAAKKV
ncbi:MAG: PilN domain-containing protein [Piscinibacter sp.]|uniref:PilN domain-containing protein n=1 Tax=Piscinibacter TaxID=1114981 RepID=UPI000FDEEAB3|nr:MULTISPECIES: PilN domain-containing protein [Piscinibacter]MCW5667092.1 PilN domain-containing protein [Piscinibacter sp.]